jgi:hypothetical protein
MASHEAVVGDRQTFGRDRRRWRRLCRRRIRGVTARVEISEGLVRLIWRSDPGPPAVTVALRRAVQHSLYAWSAAEPTENMGSTS